MKTSEYQYSFNSYTYCLNNPLKYTDPSGWLYKDVDDIWEVNEEGRVVNHIPDKTQDAIYKVAKDADGNYQRTYTIDADGNIVYDCVTFPYGTIESQKSISFSPDGKTTDTYDVYKVRGDANGTSLFEFFSNNITGKTGVEFSQAMAGIKGNRGLNFITTGHMKGSEPGMTHLLNGRLLHGYTLRELNHAHPYTPYPSSSDLGFASEVSRIMNGRNSSVPTFNIYYVPGKQKIPFW